MEQSPRREVLKMIQAMLTPLQNRINALQGSFENRASSTFATTAVLTAPTAAILTTAVIKAKTSGLFLVTVSGNATAGAVEAAGFTLSLDANLATVAGAAITVTGGTTGTPNNGISTSSATTAITLATVSAATVLATQEALNGLASSALVAPFSFSAICGGSVTTNVMVPVPVGSNVAYSIVATIATTTITLTNFVFSVVEIPN